MIKKLSITTSILLLLAVLMISCNNKDKTGSNSKGLGYYAGEWTAVFTEPSGIGDGHITIGKDGTVTSQNFGEASNIIDNGNESYQMTFYNTNEDNKAITVTFLFSSDNNGTFTFEVQDSSDKGKGTLTKTTVSLQ
ncbi:hypothetical protein [Brachyspira murdochii]|uniref:hypothetical protein n=1 Tax=Brachyspira murdochii TaxID=84378 RepID=UPI0012F48EE7|nr:hypothetical protein [Brachyspira murdochii]